MVMKKAILKQIILILCMVLVCVSFGNYLYESNAQTGLDAANFDKFDKEVNGVSDAKSTVNKLSETIITIVRIAAVTIAIVMLLIIGARYMVSAPGDRADLKKHAIAYVVGAFVLFGVSGILTIIQGFADQIGK